MSALTFFLLSNLSDRSVEAQLNTLKWPCGGSPPTGLWTLAAKSSAAACEQVRAQPPALTSIASGRTLCDRCRIVCRTGWRSSNPSGGT